MTRANHDPPARRLQPHHHLSFTGVDRRMTEPLALAHRVPRDAVMPAADMAQSVDDLARFPRVGTQLRHDIRIAA